ncbi:MAG: hypothetical protein QM673_17360, partial [Gordonia sp. (in: high G+C Gram-positive bacteria)]
MSADFQRIGLAEDLANRSDDALAALLTRRPDLASPPPQGTKVLAQRALTSASVALAGDGLDLLTLAVIEAVITVGTAAEHAAVPAPITADAVIDALTGRAARREISARIDLLLDLALLWGRRDALNSGVQIASALPWKALHLTGPLAAVPPDELTARIGDLDERPRELLATLARGPALGRSRDAAPGADPDSPVARLISLGLLARVDDQTVELPPMIGRLLRGDPPLRTDTLAPPDLADPAAPRRFSADAIDATGGGEALEAIRHTTSLLEALGATPAAVLRSGALGVRELRRLAKVTGLSQERVAFLVEIAGHARLIDAGFPEPPPPADRGEQAFAPTSAADSWLHLPPERQWATLLDAWLDMPRRAWTVGEPDRDGNANPALSSDLYDPTASPQRYLILRALTFAPGAEPFSTASVCAGLAWRHPHQMRRLGTRVVDETIAEARHLGVVAHQSLTSVGRLAVAGQSGPKSSGPEKSGPEKSG